MSSLKKWILSLFLIAFVGGIAFASVQVRDMLAPVPEGDPQLVTIPVGASAAEIGELLEAAGLVRHSLFFRLWLRWQGQGGELLRAGDYWFTPGETMEDIVGKLIQGTVVEEILTIPEGLTVRQIAQLVAQRGLATEEEFLQAARQSHLIEEFLPEGLENEELLEGYLFPDTYHFRPQVTAETMVETMVERFREVFTLELREQASSMGFTAHEIATLASIIEREAMVSEERPIIGGVYHNRLRTNMRMDADPTVLYAAGRTSGPVYRSELEADSPYNTYRRIGLPPGPISNFGVASLQAALYPEEVDYFYFVSKNDGTGAHDFSVNYAEHQRKVRIYQN